MRVKRSIFSAFLWQIFIGISLIISGCEHDYYQPDPDKKGSGSSLFGDTVSVPATFTWATMHTVNVTVQVDDQYNGQYYYIVELFDANPIFNKEATLLSKGVARQNNPFTTEVVLPGAVEIIYVQQTNPTGGKTIAAVEVTSLSLHYTFSTTGAVMRSAFVGGGETAEGMVLSAAAADQYTLPANYTEVTQTSGQLSLNLSKGPYLISGSFSGTTTFWGTGEIYVTGTLEVRGQLQIPKNCKLIVLQGGSVVVRNNDMEVLQGALFYNNGTVDVQGILFTSGQKAVIINDHQMDTRNLFIYTNDVSVTNNGTLNVEDEVSMTNKSTFINRNEAEMSSLSLDNGTFVNEGTVTVKETTQATNRTVKIINRNLFTTKKLYLSGYASLQNDCHMQVGDFMVLTEASIVINEGALLTTAVLDMNNTSIMLGSAAMMHVTDRAMYWYNAGSAGNGFFGTGTRKALLKIHKAEAWSMLATNIIHYQGNLEIECYDHPAEIFYPWRRWTQNGVTWAGEGGSTLVIPATECNEGGNNNAPPTPPSNPTFPIIYEGSDLTYLFEDNWPYLGDYDMNDLVMDVTPTYSQDANNKVTQMRLDIVLRAVGATKSLGVGLQLDGVSPSSITNVTRSNNAGFNGSIFSPDNKGLEKGQTYAVIPIFDFAHQALGNSSAVMINTIKGSPNSVQSMTVSFTVNFSVLLESAAVAVDKFNLFLVNGGYKNKRNEIHLSGFAPTDKADHNRFGFADDNSNNKYYTSKENLIWGLAIPGSAKYPVEWTSIRLAYPELEGWVVSEGKSNKDWYQHPVETLVYDE